MNARRSLNLSDERRTLIAPEPRIRGALSQRTSLTAKTLSDRIVTYSDEDLYGADI